MANKSRRAADREIRLSKTQMEQPGMEKRTKDKVTESRSSSKSAHLAEQYHYVGAELRRIALIAAAMMIVLIGLALLLP